MIQAITRFSLFWIGMDICLSCPESVDEEVI